VDLTIDPALVGLHDELTSYLDALDGDLVAGTLAEIADDPFRIREHGKALTRRLGEDGWLGRDWPVEFGGRGGSALEQWIFLEVMSYRRLPAGGLTINSIGPTLARLGSEEQRRRYLGPIMRGEVFIAVGYTEPDAGTDLASLRTRAVRDGDGYVVTGQKLYTTAADVSTHLWLAARTGDPDSRHRGISIFMVPMDTPGITVRPIHTQGDERTNEVFLDSVFVPVDCRIGAENEGWRAVVIQLNLERLFAHGDLRRELDDIVDWAVESGRFDDDERLRLDLAQLYADLEVAKVFALRAAWMLSNGLVPEAEASMTKVWFSELRQRVALRCLDLIGPDAQLRGPDATMGGRLEHLYRASTVLKFAGGTNELQRDLIAQRALGMPR
jgi:alkylation response protein AidB-like acyl-CoA dehydrogenase